jgi:hypothetical protein
MNTCFLRTAAIALVIAAISLAGCDDKTEDTPPITINDAAKTQTAFADQTTLTRGITFTATAAWTATATEGTAKAGTVAWLAISPDHGEAGTHTVNITLEPNATGADRSATVTVTSGEMSVSIVVTQKGTKEDGTAYKPEDVLLLEGVSMESESVSSSLYKFEYDEQDRLTKYFSHVTSTGAVDIISTLSYNSAGDVAALTREYTQNPARATTMQTFTKTGDKITVEGDGYDSWGSKYTIKGTIDLNPQGLPVKYVHEETYKDVNPGTGKEEITSYTYENTYGYRDGNMTDRTYGIIHSVNGGGGQPIPYSADITYDDKNAAMYNCKTPKWFLLAFPLSGTFHSVQNNPLTEVRTRTDKESTGSLSKENFTYTYSDAGFPVTCERMLSEDFVLVYEYTYVKK